jgi:hypothetical protein
MYMYMSLSMLLSKFDINLNDSLNLCQKLNIPIYTYHSRFIPQGLAEAFPIFFRDAHVLPNAFDTRNTADVSNKLIVV